MDDHFTFTPPPECPVFRPTKEEFKDPLEYIDQIKPIAVKSGICKIIPPDDWRPPFSVNVNTFQFTPRVQKLYELEAQSRVKLNFMTKLAQFVSLQGNDKLKIPNINGKQVDLYQLHKFVNDEGGYDHVIANKMWSKIGNKLGYKNSGHISTLRTHYEKIILPFDIVFSCNDGTDTFVTQATGKPKPVLHPSTTKKRKMFNSISFDESNKELKALQFVGAGPRMLSGSNVEIKIDELISGPLKRKSSSEYICKVCGSGDREDRLLICDNIDCQESYHCECLVPVIINFPKLSWKCQNCVLKVLNKKPVEFGFPSSSTTYTLYDFGRSADRFKANYFGKELHEVVSCSIVEKEFWKILQSFNDDVIVEYGADIHSSHQGSGFPTVENINNGKCALNNGELNMDLAIKYSHEPWNLNNLPLNKRSILSYIRGNIDGMKVPWCYVGMVFSSFCWHIEDHWSFSINYLHWGEPKTWYGVSSENAVQFETVMKKEAPELFENNEDLLHHITTIMNPNILQREGVPIYRTDQHAGQFVVTFPRAYHAGFNQGFNFAEAVNFCPATWLPMGRACIDHYVQLGRHCVFSHEELLCTIAEAALLEVDDIGDEEVATKYPLVSQLGIARHDICLDMNIRRVVHAELQAIVAEEMRCRGVVEARGFRRSERRLFENVPDDDRACAECQTTVFLSAMECQCVTEDGGGSGGDMVKKEEAVEMEEGELEPDDDRECTDAQNDAPKRIVCLRHVQGQDRSICPCSVTKCTLLYRFELGEIERLLTGLEVRLHDFHSWERFVKAHFTEGPMEGSKRTSLDRLRETLKEGAANGFHSCDEYIKCRALLERGESLASVCDHWLRVIANSGDCEATSVPRTVLLDCVVTADDDDHSGTDSVHIRTVQVAAITEDNLRSMAQTLHRFPVLLPCARFEHFVATLIQWRQDSVRAREALAAGSDPGEVLSMIVALFEEARRSFPGWTALSDERTCLMLVGKSLQWMVRARAALEAVTAGGRGETCDGVASLPRTMVSECVLVDLVNHGRGLMTSTKDVAGGDLLAPALRGYLGPLQGMIQAQMDPLEKLMVDVDRAKHDCIALCSGRRGAAQMLTALCSVSTHCLTIGVRTKEYDHARLLAYRSCLDTILARPGTPAPSTGGQYLTLDQAVLALDLGGALFAEAVLDRDDQALTQRHLAAKAQLALVCRAVRKVRAAYVPEAQDHEAVSGSPCTDAALDTSLVRLLVPRHYSLDSVANESRLDDNCRRLVDCCRLPSSSVISNDCNCPTVAMMTAYQAMITEEVASIDQLCASSSSTQEAHHHCVICHQQPLFTNHHQYCTLCAPRSRRPTITDMAQLNKLLKQSPNIVSVSGVALQALSKRTVTWLESLVTVLRSNVPYLAPFYWHLDQQQQCTIPLCIKELFPATTKASVGLMDTCDVPSQSSVDDLVMNLAQLLRVGHCLEVNVTSYLVIISSLLMAARRDSTPSTKPLTIPSNNIIAG